MNLHKIFRAIYNRLKQGYQRTFFLKERFKNSKKISLNILFFQLKKKLFHFLCGKSLNSIFYKVIMKRWL